MLNYAFPTIKTLDDVFLHVLDRENITLSRRDKHFILAYDFSYVGAWSFDPLNPVASAVIREARGSVYNEHGEIISRPYHKFFNVGEYDDVSIEAVDAKLKTTKAFKFDKLDGSMIHGVPFNHGPRLFTKKGLSDTAMRAEQFAAKNPHILRWIESRIDAGWTPIFEWQSRKDQIVLNHENDSLVLTAMRDIEYGEYAHPEYMSCMRNIPVCPWEPLEVDSIAALRDEVKTLTDLEGFVIRFEDGHMVKLKSDWYWSMARTFNADNNERTVVTLYNEEKLDDVIANCTPDRAMRLKAYSNAITEWIKTYGHSVVAEFQSLRMRDVSVKDFATTYAKDYNDLDRMLIFLLYRDSYANLSKHLRSFVQKRMTTLKEYEAFKADYAFPTLWVEE